IRLRQLTGLALAGAETVFQVTKEGRIDVDALIVGAIERPHGGLCHPAARLVGGAGEHDQPRRAVILIALLEDLLPAVLGVAQRAGEDWPHWAAGGAGLALPLGGGTVESRLVPLPAAGDTLGPADQQARIDAERPADQAENHDGADAQA